MTDLDASPTPRLLLDLLFAALQVRDERLNALAAELLARFGDEPVRRLVLEAVSRKNTPAHRLRVLGVLARIGKPTDLASELDLHILTADPNPEIRAAAIALVNGRGRDTLVEAE